MEQLKYKCGHDFQKQLRDDKELYDLVHARVSNILCPICSNNLAIKVRGELADLGLPKYHLQSMQSIISFVLNCDAPDSIVESCEEQLRIEREFIQ